MHTIMSIYTLSLGKLNPASDCNNSTCRNVVSIACREMHNVWFVPYILYFEERLLAVQCT